VLGRLGKSLRELLAAAAVLAIGMAGLGLLMLIAGGDADQLVLSDAPAVEPYFPEPLPVQEPQMPASWILWCREHGAEPIFTSTIAQVADTYFPDEQLIDCAALTALLYQESRLRHWDGWQIIRGDHGGAIGIGQIHNDKLMKWQPVMRERFGADFDLRDLRCNIQGAAYLLFERGGWRDGDEQAQLKALSYYNTGKHGLVTGYAQTVHATYRQIRDFQPQEAGHAD